MSLPAAAVGLVSAAVGKAAAAVGLPGGLCSASVKLLEIEAVGWLVDLYAAVLVHDPRAGRPPPHGQAVLLRVPS